MATRSASIQLLAPPADVWRFVSEPRHLADWWPNLASVEPDRRGFGAGARWRVRARDASWLRRANDEDTLLVHAAETNHRFAFELARAGVRVELELVAVEPDRSNATLTVATGSFLPVSRKLPADALVRLRALVQTAAER